MAGDKRFKTAFNYFGSKFNQLKWLIPIIPEPKKGVNDHLAEVMSGSAVLTINTPPYPINTINDINGEVVNFFRVLRDHPDELIRLLNLTPHSHQVYDEVLEDNSWMAQSGPIFNAWIFFIKCRQSFGGLGSQNKKGWSMATRVTRCKISEATNKWLQGIEGLYEIAERLRTVQIDNRDFRNLMPKINHQTTVLFIDPPYDLELSPGSKDYKFTMTEEDHRDLSELSHKHCGKVLITGYDTRLMRDLYGDWMQLASKGHHNHLGVITNKTGKRTAKQECVWVNYDPFEKGLFNNQNNGKY